MVRYSINDIPVERYGFRAGWINGGAKAYGYPLTGQFNLPKRTGAIHHEWGASGVEPYVDQDDITFNVRDLSLSIVAKATSLSTFAEQIKALYNTLGDSFMLNDRHVLLCQADVEAYHNGWGQATLKLQEVEPIKLSELKPVPVRQEVVCGIDGHSWVELGMVISGLDNRYDLPAWSPLQLTMQHHISGSRAPKVIVIKGTIIASDYADFKARIELLQTVIGRAGVRTVRYFEGSVFETFCVEGFTIDDVRRFNPHAHWAQFECKMIVINQ